MKTATAAVTLLAALALGSARAAAPVVLDIDPGVSFAEYTGSAPVGQGNIDDSTTLFYVDEQTVDGVKSWFIFFDPAGLGRVDATLHFDLPIQAVLTTKSQLQASHAPYGVDIDGNGLFDDYAMHRFIGLERRNWIGWSAGGHELELSWTAADPGDHVRVLLAVPEPPSPMLFAAGLAGLALMLHRRRGA
jgi:hypothetical protein